MRATIESILAGRYDWRAPIGAVVAFAPELLAWLLDGPDAPTLDPRLRMALRVLGVLLAAQGRSLLVRG